MPHYYVSVQHDHKVFKYIGYIHPLNEDFHRKMFERHGPGGIAKPDTAGGPYKVITFSRYEGDRILEDGTLHGEQKYSPKQLILTRRVGSKIWRHLWAAQSSPAGEAEGFEHALAGGYMMHAFQVGDEGAWDMALNQHKEIEAHQKGTKA